MKTNDLNSLKLNENFTELSIVEMLRIKGGNSETSGLTDNDPVPYPIPSPLPPPPP